MFYIFTLDAHDIYGPFAFPIMASMFAIARGVGSYTIMTEQERRDDPYTCDDDDIIPPRLFPGCLP